MTSLETVKTSLTENYFNFYGRASRSEYWYYQLYLILGTALFLLIVGSIESASLRLRNTDEHLRITTGFFIIVYVIVGLGLLIPSMSLAFRRMHDLNLSGWWLLAFSILAYFIGIPQILITVCIGLFMTQAGTVGDNKYYGCDPIVKTTFLEKPLDHYWSKYRLIISSCIAFGLFLVYFAFFKPIVGYAPVVHDDGYTEYHLISRKTDEERGRINTDWVLRFPSELKVKQLGVNGRYRPSLGGGRSGYKVNKTLSFHLALPEFTPVSKADVPIDENTVYIHLRADEEKYNASIFDRMYNNKCRSGKEISSGVFNLIDVPKAEAELIYEKKSYSSSSFEEYYASRYEDACNPKYFHANAKYSVYDTSGRMIGAGFCRDNEQDLCIFQFWLPFNRLALYKISEKNIGKIQNIHLNVIRFLAQVTDQEKSLNVSLLKTTDKALHPFVVSEFVPKPRIAQFNLASNEIPQSGFKAMYVDREKPNAPIYEELVDQVAIQYSYKEFHKIPPESFASYWVGKLTFDSPTSKSISISESFSDTIIRINGVVVYESTSARRRSKYVSYGGGFGAFVSQKNNYKKEFIYKFPIGESIIEVEHNNDYHTVGFNVTIEGEKEYLSRSRITKYLKTTELNGAKLYYVGTHGSSRKGRTIDVQLPSNGKPIVLWLDSYDVVNWKISNDSKIIATIIGSKFPGSQATGKDLGRIIHVNKPIGIRSETRSCKCSGDSFQCRSNFDVNDLAKEIRVITGMHLAGYALDYESENLKISPYRKDVEQRIKRIRAADRQLKTECE